MDIDDVFGRSLAVSDSRASHLGTEIQRHIDERKRIEAISWKRHSKNQSQFGKYKEAAMDIYSLRADVQSLSSILDRKFQVLKDSDEELKLILEMYRRKSTDSRDKAKLSDALKSKNEENEAYLSKIEFSSVNWTGI
ncbi:E3 ubiquitin-protein ligase BRE1-like 1-like protein [Corchorus capsularis]|uniref:E3 ubiquitin-protein ligase BRE1-like 1-like protein n=1 Tax=Corchorus capsularis TaxID=210143 RepID=A0A1R3I7L2_COCAP|nr:E3 ubiquitin-protein ligase BRE1-like 1-like protein [Corchorus capsularis]